MFKENKYTLWYYKIIENRRQNPYNGYTEKHHIIPKSLGGTNKKDNLVSLTAREHFICHWLLTKMTDSKGMRLALLSMTRSSRNQDRYKINSRTFQMIREQASLAVQGSNNPNYGKKHSESTRRTMSQKVRNALDNGKGFKKHTEETKKKISEANKGNKHSAETRARWSNIRKGRPGQDNNSGRRWFNNGVHSVLRYECPEGYVQGRL